MGCCSPGNRTIVNEEEEKLNDRGKDSIPIGIKIVSILIVIAVIAGLMVFS
ncbi:hypothetical protein DFR59_10227 [Falsibacillus pallidus]|uniref:Uncharacterized protein n=1 Tax=Falsibacillus pallidus TaxID=493781 RepID=A0A370GTZ5_9BACI|nr:hypothetical protein DFR59_10227 [Falsibacillus pallidus]